MFRRIYFFLPLVIFTVMIIVFRFGLSRDPNFLPSRLVNKTMPHFSSPSLEKNNEMIVSEQFKGKITLLNIWATWCNACQIEHPLLMDLAKDTEIQLYGLNYKDDRNNASQYLIKEGNPYQKIIYDPEGKLAIQFGVYATPESFLIDKKGLIRYRYVGPLTLELLENDLIPRIKQMKEEG